jgi:enamine deaminase RidA (YjgF/YER057c/UK114 family)
MDKQPEMTVEFLKPERLWDSTKIGFSQVVRVRNPGAIVFAAGQTPEDGQRKPMAAGDFEAQARIAFTNLKNALAAAGASFQHVVKMNVFIADIESNQDVFRKVRNEFINTGAPPASTMVEIAGLAQKQMLVEIEAVAVLGGS